MPLMCDMLFVMFIFVVENGFGLSFGGGDILWWFQNIMDQDYKIAGLYGKYE